MKTELMVIGVLAIIAIYIFVIGFIKQISELYERQIDDLKSDVEFWRKLYDNERKNK